MWSDLLYVPADVVLAKASPEPSLTVGLGRKLWLQGGTCGSEGM